MRTLKLGGFILIICISTNAYAIFGSAAAIPHLIKIVVESKKRYNQLRSVLREGRAQRHILEQVNSGLDRLNHIQNTLPVEDEAVLKELQSMGIALSTIKKLYGEIPDSAESAIQELHDKSIAESLKMNVNISKYAKEQEDNAIKITESANALSPKGALRANAQTNAQILHTLNQLLKVNGQMLKLQSEKLALDNKYNKDSVNHFNTVGDDLKKSKSMFSDGFKLPEFE
ncbi:hypothetical protein MRY82_06905 [bacterium]|nr:hypothetical protein [bacterium]